MTKEIVVAAYDKNLNWLDNLNNDIKKTVYRKGNMYQYYYDNEIRLDNNIGRCVHTFFNHIYQNYNTLSDYTFFVQDYPFDHWEDVIDVINNNQFDNKCQLQIDGYYGFHFNTITAPSPAGGIMWTLYPTTHHGIGNILFCSSDGHEHDSNSEIDVNRYWSLLFNEPVPNRYEFMPGGHFGITKEHAHTRSKKFYKKILELLETEDSAPWMIERLECYIFNPKYKTKL